MGYSLRTDRWRYTEWQERKTGKVMARELYDHSAGPLAETNLVDDPKHNDVVSRLAKMMHGGWKAARPG